MAFHFVMREQLLVRTKKYPNFYFHEIETIYHLSLTLKFYSRIKCKNVKNSTLNKLILEKAPLNFPVYALRDIETAVREGFRVGQKMSFC